MRALLIAFLLSVFLTHSCVETELSTTILVTTRNGEIQEFNARFYHIKRGVLIIKLASENGTYAQPVVFAEGAWTQVREK